LLIEIHITAATTLYIYIAYLPCLDIQMLVMRLVTREMMFDLHYSLIRRIVENDFEIGYNVINIVDLE